MSKFDFVKWTAIFKGFLQEHPYELTPLSCSYMTQNEAEIVN